MLGTFCSHAPEKASMIPSEETPVAESAPVTVQAEATSAVDLDAISDEEIERLLGRESESEETEAIEDAKR